MLYRDVVYIALRAQLIALIKQYKDMMSIYTLMMPLRKINRPDTLDYNELIDMCDRHIKTLDDVIEVFVSGCNDKYFDDRIIDKLYTDLCDEFNVIYILLGYTDARYNANEFAHAEILSYRKTIDEKYTFVNDIYEYRNNIEMNRLKDLNVNNVNHQTILDL